MISVRHSETTWFASVKVGHVVGLHCARQVLKRGERGRGSLGCGSEEPLRGVIGSLKRVQSRELIVRSRLNG